MSVTLNWKYTDKISSKSAFPKRFFVFVKKIAQFRYNYAERTENHRVAGAKYKAIIRELEEIFSKGAITLKNQDLNNLLNDMRNRLDALEQEAPVVPHWIYDKIEKRYSKVVFTQKAAELYRSTAN